MSASDEEFQYHLTPTGWVKGSDKIDISGWRKRPIPEDRLVTVGFCEYLSSGFSRLELTAEIETFASDDEIADALKKHGSKPHHCADRSAGWPEFVAKHQA